MFKRIGVIAVLAAGGYWYWFKHDAPVFDPGKLDLPEQTAAQADAATSKLQSGAVVTLEGKVERLLTDDTEGSPHQRFIVKLADGRTVLVAHNIDLAARVLGLSVGTAVRMHGEYEWNEKGGVLHWTHKDPAGKHEAGWIEVDGKRYD